MELDPQQLPAARLRMHQVWSVMDLAKLRHEIRKNGMQGIYNHFPDRSRGDVYSQAVKNGFYTPRNNESVRPWEEDELIELREQIQLLGPKKFSTRYKRFDRSPADVRTEARNHGLLQIDSPKGRSEESKTDYRLWTDEERRIVDNYVKRVRGYGHVSHLVDALPNRKPRAIRQAISLSLKEQFPHLIRPAVEKWTQEEDRLFDSVIVTHAGDLQRIQSLKLLFPHRGEVTIAARLLKNLMKYEVKKNKSELVPWRAEEWAHVKAAVTSGSTDLATSVKLLEVLPNRSLQGILGAYTKEKRRPGHGSRGWKEEDIQRIDAALQSGTKVDFKALYRAISGRTNHAVRGMVSVRRKYLRALAAANMQ